MKQILAIAITDIRIMFQERSTWFVTFLMPVIFTAALASTLGGPADDNRSPLLVVNEEGGTMAAQVVASLADSEVIRMAEGSDEAPLPTTRAEALARLEDYTRVLVLPKGFTERIEAGEPIAVELHLGDDADAQRTRAVQQELAARFARLGAAAQSAQTATEQAAQVRAFGSNAERDQYWDAALAQAQALQVAAPITVAREQANRAEGEGVIARGAGQSSPGQLVTFALVTVLGISVALTYERTVGTLRRLLTAPISKAQILTGKMLGHYAVGVAQMAVLIGVGQWVFGVQWGQSPVALVLMVLAFALAAVGIGVFMATVARSAEQANQMGTAASMLMAAVGGAWWPLEIVGEPLRTVAYLLPTGWAMDGFQNIILRGAGVGDVLLNVAVLLGFAALFLALGVRRLRFE